MAKGRVSRLPSDQIVEGLLLLFLGLMMVVVSVMSVDPSVVASIGKQRTLFPWFYAGAIGGLITISGVCWIVWPKRLEKGQANPQGDKIGFLFNKELMLLIGALIAYTVMCSYLGYVLSSVVFYIVVFRLLGNKWVSAIWIGVLTAAAFYLVFVRLGGLWFPEGVIGR